MTNKTEPKSVKLIHPDSIKEKERCPLSGSKNDDFQKTLVAQVANSLWLKHSDEKEKDSRINAALVAIMGARPQDEIEGMLAGQLVACHNASMECYRRAMIGEQTFEGRSENLNQANKLSRTYATMVEALQRYRGKGQQKMTVEHVHVHAGGQAIVGQVTRPEGEGIIIKNGEQPHAKQISHAPMPKMPSQNKKKQHVSVTSNE